MAEPLRIYGIAEARPVDALAVAEMRRALASLAGFSLGGHRTPPKLGPYSPLEVLKLALEILFEFSPSAKTYREAKRTIRVYSEDDRKTFESLSYAFSLFANSVFAVYGARKHIDSLKPDVMFLEGVPYDLSELQRVFRSVGVKPPELPSLTARRMVYLDDGYEPYERALQAALSALRTQRGREKHWLIRTLTNLPGAGERALIRAGADHVDPRSDLWQRLRRLTIDRNTGAFPNMLREHNVGLMVIFRAVELEKVFGK